MSAPRKAKTKPRPVATREVVATMRLNADERVLWRVQSAVRRGVAPSPEDMQELAAKLGRILDGGDPAQELGLSKRGAGRPSKADEHLAIAVDVASRIRKRGDLEPALAAVAQIHKQPKGTVRTIYYDHKAEATDQAETLRAFIRDQAEFRKAYKELEREFGRDERDRIFGELPARVAVNVARRLRVANVSEYSDLMEEIRRIFPTK